MGRISDKKKVRTALGTHLILQTDDLGKGLTMFLREEFTRSNPKYHRLQHMGYWTGDEPKYHRSWAFEEPWLFLPRGAIDKVKKILVERRMRMRPVYDRRLKLPEINLSLKKELYGYQEESSDMLVVTGNGIVRGPCGSGKTVTLLGAIVKLRQPTLIVVHTEGLMNQWKQMIMDWMELDGAPIVPGTIGGGRKDNIRPITIAMQQTIWRRENAPWINDFGCVVGDEIHHWASRTFQVTGNMFPAIYRVGCSADERRKDGLEFMIYDTFGPCVHQITKEELVEMGKLVPVRMEIVPTEYTDEDYLATVESNVSPDWNAMLNNMVKDKRRNRLIFNYMVKILRQKGTRVLLLNERVEWCRDWVDMCNAKGIKAGLMIGGKANRQRLEDSIIGLRRGRIRVGVGTKVADEWVDIPSLTHTMCTCPVHTHPKRMNQMGGRTAREWKNKKEGVLVYFWDELMFPKMDQDFSQKERDATKRKFLRRLGGVCASWEVVK